MSYVEQQHNNMAISLKINVVESSMVKTLMFDPTTTIYDACRLIRDRLAEPINNCMYFILFTYLIYIHVLS